MATKDKDKNGPATQRTGTVGVHAIGVNHGMTRQEAVKPTPQQAMAQLSQTAPVVVQAAPQQVAPQNNANAQQIPVNQPTQAATTPSVVQPQQFTMPQQITMPNGQVINLQPQQQPMPQQGQMPQQVTIGNNTYQMPTQSDTKPSVQQPKEKSAAQQNEEYERDKQYNQLVDEYLKAGGNPNTIRQHNDPAIERMQPTAEQVQQAQQAQAKAAKDEGDEIQKTLLERLNELTETKEDREAREKREARQRRFAAISEGLANVFNVGGAIAGARPAQWKSGVGELYTNQEAESDKRRLEYRQALKDMIDYRTAIRNGDIAQARAIEERRRNDFYERKMLEDIASKQANDELKKQKQEADTKRADKLADARIRDYDDKHEKSKQQLGGTYKPSGNTKSSSDKGGGGRGRKGSTGKTPKQLKQEAINRGKAAAKGTAFQKKR